MEDIVTGVLAAAGVTTVAGAACLAHLLRRDRAITWHPGDDLPDVPEDAPIRTWHASPAAPATSASRK